MIAASFADKDRVPSWPVWTGVIPLAAIAFIALPRQFTFERVGLKSVGGRQPDRHVDSDDTQRTAGSSLLIQIADHGREIRTRSAIRQHAPGPVRLAASTPSTQQLTHP